MSTFQLEDPSSVDSNYSPWISLDEKGNMTGIAQTFADWQENRRPSRGGEGEVMAAEEGDHNSPSWSLLTQFYLGSVTVVGLFILFRLIKKS